MTPEPSASTVAALAGAMAHPVRVRALCKLAAGPDDGIGFTALRDAVGLRDNGRFNYHLDALRDHLVAHDDERYRLTPAGCEAAHLLTTGHLDAPSRRRPLQVRASCQTCGGALALTCRPDRVRIDCADCAWDEEWAVRPPVAAFTAAPREAADAVDRAIRAAGRALADGHCPTCFGTITPALTATETDQRSLDVAVEADCEDCGRVTATPGLLALAHDATAGFFHDNDVALTDRAVWGLSFVATDQQTRVRSRDPWRVEVRPQLGTDELVLRVDETASVSAVKRHTKFAARDVWYPNRVRS